MVFPLIRTEGQAGRQKIQNPLGLLVWSSLQHDQSSLLRELCIPLFPSSPVSINTKGVHRHAVPDLHDLTTIQPFAVILFLFLMKPHPIHVKYSIHRLTGCGGLADKSDELLLDLLHSVQVIHEEDVSVAGLAGDVHQLPVVCVRKADGKDDVTWQREQQSKKVMLPNKDKRENG